MWKSKTQTIICYDSWICYNADMYNIYILYCSVFIWFSLSLSARFGTCIDTVYTLFYAVLCASLRALQRFVKYMRISVHNFKAMSFFHVDTVLYTRASKWMQKMHCTKHFRREYLCRRHLFQIYNTQFNNILQCAVCCCYRRFRKTHAIMALSGLFFCLCVIFLYLFAY